MGKNRIDSIMVMYELMRNIKKIFFRAKSLEGSKMEWNYTGEGDVIVMEGSNRLYFFEEIVLNNEMRYSDRKLWEFKEDFVKFFRFRNGDYEKIFEFLFCDGEFVMKKEYLCSPDLYCGEINVLGDKICLLIRVKGEKKNEVLEYTYLI